MDASADFTGEEIEADPDVIQNENPQFISTLYYSSLYYLQTYGWLILFIFICLVLLKRQLDPYIDRLLHSRSNTDALSEDPDTALARHEAMEVARRRMQEQYDALAARAAEQRKLKEEERKQQKVEEHERLLKGEGSKKAPPVAPSNQPASVKPTTTRRIRQGGYNPLTGDSSSRFRPERRGGGAGGG